MYHYRWYLSMHGHIQNDFTDEEFLSSLAQSPGVESCVKKALADIVSTPAITQGIKGLASAGILRSFRYSLDKVKKAAAAKR